MENKATFKWRLNTLYEKMPVCGELRRPLLEFNPAYEAWRGGGSIVVPVIGALAAGWLTQRAGRRVCIFVGVLMMTIAQLIAGVTGIVALFTVAMSLHRAGMLIALQGTLLQTVESVPAARRGVLMALAGVCYAVGGVTSSYLDFALTKNQWSWGFRLSLLLGMWPALIILGVTPWIPESPVSLLQRDRLHDARQALQALRGELADVHEEYECVKQAVLEVKGRATWSLLRERSSRPSLLISLALGALAALTGPALLLDPTTSMFRPSADHPEDMYFYLYLMPGLMELAGTLLAMALIDSRVGRRGLLTYSALATCLLATSTACVLGRTQDLWSREGPRSAVAALYYLMHVTKATGWWVCVYVVVTELLALRARAIGLAVFLGAHFAFRDGLEAGLHYLRCPGRVYAFTVVAISAFIAAGFSHLMVPETRGVPLERVTADCVLPHWYWRRYAPQPPAPPPQQQAAGGRGALPR
ncbi:MAG: general substrate transporter [Monoraphidium minutum]|nr:MAG: general substrate transporter [Monoraphidium minutum]